MACEKCWSDATSRAFSLGNSTTEEYHKLLDERRDTPCSPEEQCGEMHLVFDWKDGTRHCVCGVRRDPEGI